MLTFRMTTDVRMMISTCPLLLHQYYTSGTIAAIACDYSLHHRNVLRRYRVYAHLKANSFASTIPSRCRSNADIRPPTSARVNRSPKIVRNCSRNVVGPIMPIVYRNVKDRQGNNMAF